MKKRFGDRDELMKQKAEAHRVLVALQSQREGEIVAGVDKGTIDPAAAKKELMGLGHTADSADIQIARALRKPPSHNAPAPPGLTPSAPLPERENPPEAAPGEPLKVDDPISAKSPESQTVVYKDPAVKDAKK